MDKLSTVFDRILKVLVVWLVKLFPNVHPNWYTLIRIILILPIGLALACNWYLTVLAISLIATFLDVLDGPVARYKKETSRTGAFLDPFADKLLFLVILYFFRDNFEALILFSIVILEVLLLTEHIIKFLYLRKQTTEVRKEKQKSPLPGKLKVWGEMLSLLAAYCDIYFNFNLRLIGNSLLSIAVILAVYSLTTHVSVYFEKK